MRQSLSVGNVAARVNMSVSTLRTWDRRYGVGPSSRTPGGHRRYNVGDLVAIQWMQRLMAAGVTDADIASDDSAVRALVDAVFRWDIVQIDDLVSRVLAARDAARTQDDVVAIGRVWVRRFCSMCAWPRF